MKLKTLCNPFTGHEMQVAEFDDKSFVFDRAFTHETIPVAYNELDDVYIIPAACFKYIHTVSLYDAAEILGVSKTRVSAMCAKGQLQYSKTNGIMRIAYDSILDYQKSRNRKTGYSKDLIADDRDNS